MKEQIEKALKEGRLRFFKNGKYSYTPSKEYETRFSKQAVEKESTVIKNSVQKLDNLVYGFMVAEKTNKRVSHVTNGKIILV